ncbi:hypothetical protein BGZ94_007411 [Podila epigama]|nr:hypothetical protein BGZ94_007411 [Podila epigama]
MAASFLRFASYDPERPVSSFFVQSRTLIYTRAVGLFYLIAVLVGALATTSSFKYFIQFFTNIGWVALTIYYLWALILSIQYNRLSEFERTQWAKKGPRALHIIFWVVYGSQAVYQPHTGVYEWATISEHSADFVLMVMEMVLTRMVMDIRHIVFTLGFVLLYLLMSFVDHWINGTWIYPPLDYEKEGWGKTGLFYGIIVCALSIIYLILWALHRLKEKRGTKRLQDRLQAKLESDVESVASSQTEKKNEKQ